MSLFLDRYRMLSPDAQKTLWLLLHGIAFQKLSDLSAKKSATFLLALSEVYQLSDEKLALIYDCYAYDAGEKTDIKSLVLKNALSTKMVVDAIRCDEITHLSDEVFLTLVQTTRNKKALTTLMTVASNHALFMALLANTAVTPKETLDTIARHTEVLAHETLLALVRSIPDREILGILQIKHRYFLQQHHDIHHLFVAKEVRYLIRAILEKIDGLLASEYQEKNVFRFSFNKQPVASSRAGLLAIRALASNLNIFELFYAVHKNLGSCQEGEDSSYYRFLARTEKQLCLCLPQIKHALLQVISAKYKMVEGYQESILKPASLEALQVLIQALFPKEIVIIESLLLMQKGLAKQRVECENTRLQKI